MVFSAPYVAAILRRHGLPDSDQPVAGFNVTYPTFVCGDVVVKLFGYARRWRTSHAAERRRTPPSRPTPPSPHPPCGRGAVVRRGRRRLAVPRDHTGPRGALETAGLSPAQRRAVAAEVGRQVRRVHALAPRRRRHARRLGRRRCSGGRPPLSLPSHLAAQAARYVARLGPPEPVFVHADLVANHIFVDTGRFRASSTGATTNGGRPPHRDHPALPRPVRL
ncbi:MAG: phosphotransferase [Dehalococcoidia bacterium]